MSFLTKLKIVVRPLAGNDVLHPENFRDFINSLVAEKAQISENKKQSLREVKEYLQVRLKEVEQKKAVFLLVEDGQKIVGRCEIYLLKGCNNHIGILRIAVRKGYRGIGLGSYLMEEILKLAKKQLKPRLKIIKLTLFATNKISKKLYKKFGFRQVARVPKQCQFKRGLVDELVMLKEMR